MRLIKDVCLWGIATPTNGRARDLYCMYQTTARELVRLNAKLRQGEISRLRQDDGVGNSTKDSIFLHESVIRGHHIFADI